MAVPRKFGLRRQFSAHVRQIQPCRRRGLGSPFAKSNHVAGGGMLGFLKFLFARKGRGSVCLESQ
jgi:hypothetical protein